MKKIFTLCSLLMLSPFSTDAAATTTGDDAESLARSTLTSSSYITIRKASLLEKIEARDFTTAPHLSGQIQVTISDGVGSNMDFIIQTYNRADGSNATGAAAIAAARSLPDAIQCRHQRRHLSDPLSERHGQDIWTGDDFLPRSAYIVNTLVYTSASIAALKSSGVLHIPSTAEMMARTATIYSGLLSKTSGS